MWVLDCPENQLAYQLNEGKQVMETLTSFDEQCMKLAIGEARKARSRPDRIDPLVGVVAAKDGEVIATAFRGESTSGEHAEYVLLDQKLSGADLTGATIYTTLEPCTKRRHPKISCTQRLIERRVSRVIIGMLDPNPYLSGRSMRILNEAGVEIAFFPHDLAASIHNLNENFVREARSFMPPEHVHLSTYEWDLLESREHFGGRTQQGWYEYFVAANDLRNLERLEQFFTPSRDQVTVETFDPIADEAPLVELVTDTRLIEFVRNDPGRLLSLTPREFERFTAELLEKLKYKNVSIGRGSKDGGVDVTAFIEHPLGVERVIVQCKRQSHDHKVGEPVIKQLLADTDIHQAARGLMVTTSYLTRGAQLLVETYYYRLSSLDYTELSRILRGEVLQ